MLSLGLFVRLEAKPGKEQEVAAFLKQALEMANQETTTPLWFALRLGPSTFGVFDSFHGEAGRQAHLNGPIAKALMAHPPNLLAAPPSIERTEGLGASSRRRFAARTEHRRTPLRMTRGGWHAIVIDCVPIPEASHNHCRSQRRARGRGRTAADENTGAGRPRGFTAARCAAGATRANTAAAPVM